MRVHELAKELGLSSKDLMAKLTKLGVEAKTHMTMLDETTADLVKQELDPTTAKIAEEERLKEEYEVIAARKAGVEADAEARARFKPKAHKPTPPHPVRREEERPPVVAAPVAGSSSVNGKVITFQGAIIVRELADRMGLRPNQLITELMGMNILISINERLDINVARKIAERHGFSLEHEKKQVEHPPAHKRIEESDEDKPEDIIGRPPVVTFMGHVDHGKTSLLDKIRNTQVAKGEHGGITQHIGAYTIEMAGKRITFLDTPGHAAFTAMRARGANLTDIVILIVAADDGIMPQTREALMHAKSAKVPILVAINKVDLPGANVLRVMQQLQGEGLHPEEWGGDIIVCPVSAMTGEGIPHLLEMILLQAEVLQLKANPKRRAIGFVIEARMEPGMGPITNLLVTNGTLKLGDSIVCEQYWGKVRALINDHGVKVKQAGPATPIRCLGLSGVPSAGADFRVTSDDKVARVQAETAEFAARDLKRTGPKKTSLESLFEQLKADNKLELRVIIKADAQGSIEAIGHALGEIKSDKVSLNILLSGTGNVTANDVMLASASSGVILGFHVAKEPGIDAEAKHHGVDIRLHHIIYEMIDEVRAAMLGLIKPETREKNIGRAEVRKVFSLGKIIRVAGCMVVNGTVTSKSRVRVRRGTEVLYSGPLASLKHFQQDVAEVREGMECGIRMDRFNDLAEGDGLEFYVIEELQTSL